MLLSLIVPQVNPMGRIPCLVDGDLHLVRFSVHAPCQQFSVASLPSFLPACMPARASAASSQQVPEHMQTAFSINPYVYVLCYTCS